MPIALTPAALSAVTASPWARVSSLGHHANRKWWLTPRAMPSMLLSMMPLTKPPSSANYSTGRHQQKRTLLAMPYRISTLQMPYHINSKYIQGD